MWMPSCVSNNKAASEYCVHKNIHHRNSQYIQRKQRRKWNKNSNEKIKSSEKRRKRKSKRNEVKAKKKNKVAIGKKKKRKVYNHNEKKKINPKKFELNKDNTTCIRKKKNLNQSHKVLVKVLYFFAVKILIRSQVRISIRKTQSYWHRVSFVL